MDLDINNAPGWMPVDGETVIGQVVSVDRMRSSYGGQEYYPIITIRVEGNANAKVNGEPGTVTRGDLLAIHGFHYVLRSELATLRPKVGERLGVKYVGQQPSKDGKRTVTIYVVKVDGREADVWAGMAPPMPTVPASDVPVSQADFQPVNPPAAADDDIPF